jgi:hypothetical protein
MITGCNIKLPTQKKINKFSHNNFFPCSSIHRKATRETHFSKFSVEIIEAESIDGCCKGRKSCTLMKYEMIFLLIFSKLYKKAE